MAVAFIAAIGTPAVAAPSPSPDQVLPQAQATAQCAPIDFVLGYLDKHYGERVFWWGQTADDVTMIITERPDTRTWTLLAVHDGLACMVGSGGSRGAVGS
ncbi:MAG: hypothetical protein ACREFO_05940 [Acetobacteraceae bacterium]